VTPTILAYDRQYLQNYFSQRLQIWYAALYGECRAGAHIIFVNSGHGIVHERVDVTAWSFMVAQYAI